MVSKPQAFPRRLSTLPEMKTLPFAGLRWILDASRFLKSRSPRSRSLNLSRKHRQRIHKLHRSSLVDGLFKVRTCMSAIGTFETCRLHKALSVLRGEAENICSRRGFQFLTQLRHRPALHV